MILQMLVGLPLEIEQKKLEGYLKVILVYICGILATSLATPMFNPDIYIAGKRNTFLYT